MLTLNIRPNDITFRSLVLVSANLQDPVQLQESWGMIVKRKHELRDLRVSEQRARGAEGVDTSVPWDYKDWQALVSSSYALEKVAFARAELEKFKDEMNPKLYTQVWGYFAHAQERELEKKRPEGNYYGGRTKDTNTTPNTLHATFNLEKIILEVTRLLQTLKSPTVIPFSPPEAPSSGSTSTPSSESSSTTPPSPSAKTTTSKPKQSDPRTPPYLEIDMYLTSPSHPPLPTPRLQEIYNQLLSTSPSPYSGQSPRYLGPGVNNDAHNHSTTGYTLRELRFQNWVTVNRLLFEAELHERRTEAKVRRDMIQSGSSIPGKTARPIIWKDEQIRERVRQAEEKAKEELAKGEDVDIDVKSGRVVRRNEEAREKAMKGVREEEWEIRKLLGGGGLAWESEGKAIVPEMFDKREGMSAAEKPVSTKEMQPAEEKEKESTEKNEVKVKAEAAEKLEKSMPKAPISSEVTLKQPTPSPKPATTPSRPAPSKPISPASAPAPTRVSASPKPSAPAAAPIPPPLGSAPMGALSPPWPTVPFMPKPKAEPTEKLEKSKAVKKAEPSEKADEDTIARGGPWSTVPFVPRTKALPEEVPKEIKKEETKKQTRAERRSEEKSKKDKEASEAAREVREERKKKEKEAAKKAEPSKKADKEVAAKEQSTKDTRKPQPKEEKDVPEVGAVEARRAEEASTIPTPKPEPIPAPDPTNTPFASPLLHSSHITETTIPPPKGPPPSPEQVQEAMQELAALSEAENELADIFAELFAVNEKVSSAATAASPIAAEQPVATIDFEKDGGVAAIAPQGDQTPAPEPPRPSSTTTPTPSTPTPQEPKESHVEQLVREEVPRGDGPEEAAGTGSRPKKEGSE